MRRRLAISVRGVVQGVGFRPFVLRLARERGLAGWVRNGRGAVEIEVEGGSAALDEFVRGVRSEPPPRAVVEDVSVHEVAPDGGDAFLIEPSAERSEARAALPPDLAVRGECLDEVRTPGARRHGYPFTNCTQCGPRYSIVERLPYDRQRTSMRGFALCASCAADYDDPADRRFHAEPIACPACGPRLRLVAPDGSALAHEAQALARAVAALDRGEVVALEGIGGFQLLADAGSEAAVARLRERKHRPDKPFALLVGSLEAARALCELSPDEERALLSMAGPIVLLRRRRDAVPVAEGVAPGMHRLGVLLPTTPLHHLMMEAAGRPLVCTSGNLSDEPLAIDSPDALARLAGVADLFLDHDRPIVRPVDDSVARVDRDGLRLIRRARGFAPLPVRLASGGPTVLALGAHEKSTIALAVRDEAVLSQHLGDLGSAGTLELLERTVSDLASFLDARPEVIACDLHPDYGSTRLAERLAAERGIPLVRVQHHHAHVAAAIAELGLDGPVLGLAWDGTGLGSDGTIWGGEALVVDGARFERFARLRSFRLPGGERAAREPRRSALGVLHALRHDGALELARAWFSEAEAGTLVAMLERSVNAPTTTSVGRLFDAVAALVHVRTLASFEGQAAMELEALAEAAGEDEAYPLPLSDGTPAVADWGPLVLAVLEDRRRGAPPEVVSARFQNALVELALAVARRAGLRTVVASGGCFQNAYLLDRVLARLGEAGFDARAPRLVPVNDGGISLGQAWVAREARKEGRTHVPRSAR